MPIELNCTGCGQQLRVSDQDAGKQARCPTCKTVMTVPQPAAGSSFSPGQEKWHLMIGSGAPFGPVSKPELDSWVAEGRVTAEAKLRRDGQADWIPATQIYPQLAGPAKQQPAGPNPFSEFPQQQPFQQPNPYASPQGTYPQGGPQGFHPPVYRQPHRGGTILTLGILGIFCCAIMGICAWVMGNEDIKQMNMGRMDPSGRGITQAGRILGIISVVLWIISVFANLALNAARF